MKLGTPDSRRTTSAARRRRSASSREAAERLGYDYIAARRPRAGRQSSYGSREGQGREQYLAYMFQDPFVLFGFLAGVHADAGFSPDVLILAQRQAVLVAKQAACLDVLSAGASGWASASAGTR